MSDEVKTADEIELEAIEKAIAKMLTNGGVAEYQIKSRKMCYHSLDELYWQRDRLRIRITRRKNRSSVGGQNIGVSFFDC